MPSSIINLMNPFSRQEVLAFMKSVSVMSVAICDGNKPISTTLLFAIDDTFSLTFVTKENTHKVAALLKNPAISISLWQQGKMMVQASGTATPVTDPSERDAALEKIASTAADQDNFWPPVLQYGRGTPYAVFRVKLNWMQILDLRISTISITEELFTEIPLHA